MKLYGFRSEAALRERSIPVIREDDDIWYLARSPAGRWVVRTDSGNGEEFATLNAALLTIKNEIEFQRDMNKKIEVNLASLQRTVEGWDRPEDAKDRTASLRVLSKIEGLAR